MEKGKAREKVFPPIKWLLRKRQRQTMASRGGNGAPSSSSSSVLPEWRTFLLLTLVPQSLSSQLQD
jgi:hypothetical protein